MTALRILTFSFTLIVATCLFDGGAAQAEQRKCDTATASICNVEELLTFLEAGETMDVCRSDPNNQCGKYFLALYQEMTAAAAVGDHDWTMGAADRANDVATQRLAGEAKGADVFYLLKGEACVKSNDLHCARDAALGLKARKLVIVNGETHPSLAAIALVPDYADREAALLQVTEAP